MGRLNIFCCDGKEHYTASIYLPNAAVLVVCMCALPQHNPTMTEKLRPSDTVQIYNDVLTYFEVCRAVFSRSIVAGRTIWTPRALDL